MFTNKPELIKRYAPFIPGITAPLTKHTDAPAQCIRVNIEWLELIAGALETLTFPDLYTGTDDERQNAAREAVNLIGSILDGNMSCEEDNLQLRQNTLNPCLLEYSSDGGITWLPAFDYSLCSRNSKYVTVTMQDIENYSDYSQTTFNTYNGEITNVAPGWQYGDADDLYRDMALCWASGKWAEICANVAIEIGQLSAEETQSLLTDISTVLGTIGDALNDMATMKVFEPYTLIGALAFETGSFIVGIVAEFVNFDASKLSDTDAQQVVGCAIYDALAGAKPTFAAWSTALLNHGLIGNEGEIANACYLLMQSEAAYVEYMMIAADVIPAAEIAGDLGCPCDDAWEEIVDLTLATLPDYLTVDWGSHYENIGVLVSPHQAQGYNQLSCHISLTPLATNWTLTNVLGEYGLIEWGELPSNYPGLTFAGTRLAPAEPYTARSWVKALVPSPSGTLQQEVSVSNVNDVWAELRVSKFSPSGQGALKTLRLRGLGQNPFV